MTLTKEELQKVVAVGLYTDGYVYHRKWDNKYMLSFSSSDPNLHAYFQKLVFLAFGESPSAFIKVKGKNLWVTYYQRGSQNQMVLALFKLSPTFSTKKGNEPSLEFLFNEREDVKIQALRFGMSCDGSVSIKTNGKENWKCYSLRLACANPKLNLEFQKLFADIGITMRIDRDKKTWSGIHGLATGRKSDIFRFWEIGGFAPENVKVTNGKLIGLTKNEVLDRIIQRQHRYAGSKHPVESTSSLKNYSTHVFSAEGE